MTTLLGLLGALQGLILATAVTSMGGAEGRPNRALGMVLGLMSVAVLSITGEHAGLFRPPLVPILVEYTATLLFPPALWHYTNLVLGSRPRPGLWAHALPAAAWLGYVAAFAVGWTTWRFLPPVMTLVGYLAAYTGVVAIRVWRAPSRALKSHGLVLRLLVGLLLVLHLAQVVRYLLRHVPWLADVVPLTAAGMVLILSVVAFRQSRLFAGHDAPALAAKYAASTLSPERAADTYRRLQVVMERDQPFLNENLNLADLAARLAVPRAHLSQVVNSEAGINFPDFLSGYRVEAAQRLLADPAWDHLTVEAIGYQVGFRSRSAFHQAFKRRVGETPAQARRRVSPNRFEDTSRPDP